MRKKTQTQTQKKTYSNKDYQSNNGMLVAIWGPSAWHLMHTMSFNYPVHPSVSDKRNYRAYILNLVNVLPCGKCRQNLKENFKKLPLRMIDMRSRDTFSRYVYNLHELVNNMLGKNSGLSYETVKERYEHFRARCSNKTELLPKMKNYTVKKAISRGSVVSGTIGSVVSGTIGSVEKGCTEPLVGEKAKCILKIVPEKTKCKTFSVDAKCVKHRRKTHRKF
jgi:hypothetical protein